MKVLVSNSSFLNVRDVSAAVRTVFDSRYIKLAKVSVSVGDKVCCSARLDYPERMQLRANMTTLEREKVELERLYTPRTLSVRIYVPKPTPLETLIYGNVVGASEQLMLALFTAAEVTPSRKKLKLKLRWDLPKLEAVG